MGSCCNKEETDGPPTERTPILSHTTPVQTIPTAPHVTGPHMSRTDEESALNRILQKTAKDTSAVGASRLISTRTECDIIDVTYIEPHSLEVTEISGRTKDYKSQVAAMRGVPRHAAKLPSSCNQAPQSLLARELISPTDIRFISDRTEAAAAALESMEVKHGEPLVVQFAAT